MIKHAYQIAYFSCIGDIGSCGLYISNACLSLLFGIPSALIGRELATEFILNSLKIPGLKVAERIKKEIIDLINSDYFFAKCEDCFEN